MNLKWEGAGPPITTDDNQSSIGTPAVLGHCRPVAGAASRSAMPIGGKKVPGAGRVSAMGSY